MPSMTLIPTPSQRRHDATSGSDNATAVATANEAKDTANSAQSTANTAQSTANTAKTSADAAQSSADAAISEVGSTRVEAAEDIEEFVPITADGYACDCTNVAHYGHLIGISTDDTVAGFMINVRRGGLITNSAWSWTPLATIFCGIDGLTMSPSAGRWTQVIGIAQTETSMLVIIGEPILL